MAIQYRSRYRPDPLSNRSTMAGDASSGTVFLPVEICQFDDTVVTGANYRPGHPDTESNITIAYSDVIQADIAALSAMTQAARRAWLDNALDQWVTSNKDKATAVAPIVLDAQRRPPRAIP